MILSLWVFGHNVLTISTATAEAEVVTRSIGFAAAELAEPYYEPNTSVRARTGL